MDFLLMLFCALNCMQNADGKVTPSVFILAVTHGVSAHFFSDFGPSHVVTDADGEPARALVIDNFSEDGVITVAAKRHGFDDGDQVMLEDIEGAAASGDTAAITDLNGLEGIKVKRIYYKYEAKRPDGTTEKREKQVYFDYILNARNLTVFSMGNQR